MVEKSLFLILISVVYARSLDIPTLRNYDAKTCNNEPSCDLVDDPALTADRRTLRRRPCMCDAACVTYRDCCTDSKYYNELEQSRPPPFHCLSTYKVYLKTTCPETWTDEEVRSKCNISTKPLRSEDTSLIIPVTNTVKNITYGNKYCALCHEDTNFVSWLLSPLCGEAPPGLLLQQSTLLPTESTSIPPTPLLSSPIPSYNAQVSPVTTELVKRSQKLSPAPVEYSFSSLTSRVIFRRNRSSKPDSHSEGDFGSEYVNTESKYYRRKRATKVRVNFYKHYKHLQEIWSTAKYDPHSGFFVTTYLDKDMICAVDSKLQSELKPHVRPCVPNAIEVCKDAADPDTDKQCRSHTSLIFNKRNNKAYRNKYCATCDGAESTYLTGCPITVKEDSSTISIFV